MSVEWFVIRGSGLVAFALLALATIWGLLISTKVLGRAVNAKGVTWFHESLGVGALLATVAHMIALSTHDYIVFDWNEILVPGRSDWRQIAVALGVVGFYVLVIVSLSFYFKKWIGQKTWRIVHQLSLGLFVTTVAHGVLSGTDTAHPAVVAMYAGTGATVAILFTIRMLQSRAESSAAPRPRPARATTSSGESATGLVDVT